MKFNGSKQIAFAATLLTVAALLPAVARSDDKSAATYKQKCVACHGADGKGETPTGKALKVRSFASPETAKMSDDELAAIITNGKEKMPKYGASLKPEEVKDLVVYIRSFAKKS
jgi:mono/diheme cytochrome c family protein